MLPTGALSIKKLFGEVSQFPLILRLPNCSCFCFVQRANITPLWEKMPKSCTSNKFIAKVIDWYVEFKDASILNGLVWNGFFHHFSVFVFFCFVCLSVFLSFFFWSSYFGWGVWKIFFIETRGLQGKISSLDYRKLENNKEYEEICKIIICSFFVFHVTNLLNVLLKATRLQQFLLILFT